MSLQTFFNRNRKPLEGVAQQEFTPWDAIKACSHFHRDFGEVPSDLRDPQTLSLPLNGIQQELYTDLLEARAEARLPALLTEFHSFIEDGE